MNDTGASNLLASEVFVDQLAQSGLRHACICPGSRSTPVALALARHPDIQHWVLIDERSTAFFAHGMARQLGEPVAILCSSGTAAANFLPAVVESFYDRVPLIVLTADRPPELRDVGAAQTIDQLQLYGSHVKWFLDMPVPDGSSVLEPHGRAVAARAVSTAVSNPQGPVHINFPFREPLLPAGGAVASSGHEFRSGYSTPVEVATGQRAVADDVIQRLAADLTQVERGLIICGPQRDPAFAGAVTELAQLLGYPVLADPLSQVRCGTQDRSLVIDSYDVFLRDQETGDRLAPEFVLRFGAMPTSKPLMIYLEQLPVCQIVLVEDGATWRDPTASMSGVVQADPTTFCRQLTRAVDRRRPNRREQWSRQWQQAQEITRRSLVEQICADQSPGEGRIFAELATLVPDGSTIYAGNSMPVRDLDTFFPSTDREVRFLSNRGANGIDGVVSSALGAAAVSDGSLVLVVGDLSFYHDLNGLFAARKYGIDATIVVINNDGGGIFHFLPQATELGQELFEELFGTPMTLDFGPVADLYGVAFSRPGGWTDFRDQIQASLSSSGVQIVEVQTARDVNLKQHRDIVRQVIERLHDRSAAAVS